MPTPNLIKKFSKHDTSQSTSVPDVPADDKRDDVSQTVTITPSGPIPGYSDTLKEAWTAAHQEQPQARGAEKLLNEIANVQDRLSLSPGQQTVVDTLGVPAKALMDASHIAETIHNGVNMLMEAVPSLMRALDEVAKVHPFIAVAVLAFKAAYTLETKRRENDKRVLTLYVEMKDMMAVLIQLKDVSDPKQVAPDGQTIEGRMQELCEAVAEDIKGCANACDTYLKKKILTKIFAGPIWEGRLLEFVGVFTKRRGEFEFALTIHTTVGVDAANLKLDAVNEQTAELSRKQDGHSGAVVPRVRLPRTEEARGDGGENGREGCFGEPAGDERARRRGTGLGCALWSGE
ncbi:hypothetical protein BDM02DRAFT_928516 [Thelephora ganbajun]|uniref:Uncharacterized protein n=1 Tax=Thelephora ganbajun TaxID=370292 RepID=A0ACB6Z4T8_THEGA|nr:hypothetical protein BDM02DRAFT_928516 [Thelephora ganbajun]